MVDSKQETMLGSGGFIVYDEDQCIVRNTWNFTRFYHHESCGTMFAMP
jgi:NADH-quinone oxidoreductase subunit F